MLSMWPPIIPGTALDEARRPSVFFTLPMSWLQAILGAFILMVTCMPQLGRIGAQRGRFAVLGFGTVFLGVFVSATGSLLAPFIASATPDRHNLAATMGAMMTITHIAKLVAFGFIGFAIGSFLPPMAAMIVVRKRRHLNGQVDVPRTPS